jgi:hypothetical protein
MTREQKLEAKLYKLLANPSTDVLWYHCVGSYLRSLNAAPTYKSYCVDKYAKTSGLHRSTLFHAMRLAETYTKAELQALPHLKWTALRLLAAIKNDEVRQKLQQQAEHWTARQLQREIYRSGAKEKQPRGPRKYEDPNENRDLDRLTNATRVWQQSVKYNWSGERISKLQPGGKNLAALLDAASTAMEILVKALEGLAPPDPMQPTP